MGMFDYVHCYMELPDGYVPEPDALGETTFQSKDFECIMTDYTIHDNGVVTDSAGRFVPVRVAFDFYGSDNNNGWHDYIAYVENNIVIRIEKRSS